MIDVKELTVFYDSLRPAVKNVSLSIAAGEVFGFIGPNGAGKTSTIRVLAGLLKPSSGEVSVAGVDVVANPGDVRRKVGYLPDSFGVYDDLTCREYLDFFAAAQGLPARRRASVVGEVLALVDLTEQADKLAGVLSRGMQQRLGLARVLVHEPDVLLLDEPASGLDPRARVEVREILRELGRMGKTVILSSHVLSDLASACTSVGIIEQGTLVYAGSVAGAIASAEAAFECTVRVGCAEGADAIRAALASDATLSAARAEEMNGRVHVTLLLEAASGEEDVREVAAASVGACLFAAGLRLTHLDVERADLERAFMSLTVGRLA